MHRRKRKRRVSRFKIKRKFLILIIVGILVFLITEAYFQPPVMVYVRQKSYLVASKVINNAIREQVVPNIETDKLIIIDSNNDEISSIIVNTYQANLILSEMANEIYNSINEIEHNPNHELNSVTIPFSAMFSNPIVTFGPNIKVDFTIVGSVESDIVSSVKPYGINNSLFEVVIRTKVRYQIAIPFQSDEIEVVTNTPILVNIIHGKVPHFYYSSPSDNINIPDVSELY